MSLHEAMVEVLREAGRPLRPVEIAARINELGLHQRDDGGSVPSGQVSARARRYQHLFCKEGPMLTLEKSVAGIRSERSQRTLSKTSMPPESAIDSNRAERALLDEANFVSAALVDDLVPPNARGVYAFRVKRTEALPPPFDSYLRQRDTGLIYIGEADGQTLHSRMLGQELRSRSHGTFFRSIGAVLGHLPKQGSLVGKKNQKNYKFSAGDTVSIIKWLNENLEVSWVVLDENIHNVEVALIRKHTPLLNIRNNPRSLPELEILRKECRRIAALDAS